VAPVLVTLIRQRGVDATLVTICLGVFLLTAGGALWATYDRDATRLVFDHPVGWQKLWGVALAILFYYALVTIRSTHGLLWAAGLFSGLGVLVAVGFVATNDWVSQPALWPAITRVGQAMQGAIRAPLSPLPRSVLNPNVAAGVIAPLLPLGVGLALAGRRLGEWVWMAAGLCAAVVMGAALLLTTSRGAWLGVSGALALAVLWWLAGRVSPVAGPGRVSRLLVFAAAIGAMAGVIVVVWAAVGPLRRLILSIGPVANRLSIFSQAGLLVRDYPLTGSGLGTFPLVHSTYALMIHVPVLSHAHALPLNVAVEQGLVGAWSLLLTWAAAGWVGLRTLGGSHEARPLLGAALFSLAVLVFHGFADDALYSSRGILFLWVPVALVVAAARCPERVRSEVARGEQPRSRESEVRAAGRREIGRLGAIAVVVLIVGLVALVRRPAAASWHANVGAIRQTRIELHTYDYRHFGDLTLDQVRRREDLSAAMRQFQRALALETTQVTARTRLARIAMARRDYAAALEHARVSWEAGYRDRVTRLALGDALVANGRVEEAAHVIRGLERAGDRLEWQAFYAYERYDDWERAAYAWRTVLILDPGHDRARAAAARADEKAGQP
jgi:O-antigen ligase